MLDSSKGSGFQAQGPGQEMQPVYNDVRNGIAQQNSFVNALNAQNGIKNQSAAFNQLQGVANGTGANPAQAQFQNNINNANQNAAGAIASQKGINPAMAAKLLAQQQGQNTQAAAGQAAAQQANQQLGAIGQMGGIAGQQVAQQAAGIQGLNAAVQGNQGQLLGVQENANNVNGQIAQGNQKGQQGILSGITGAAGSFLGLAHGGQVPGMYADGGNVDTGIYDDGLHIADAAPDSSTGAKSNAGKFLTAFSQGMSGSATPATSGVNTFGTGVGNLLSKGVKSIFAPAPAAPPMLMAAPGQAQMAPVTFAKGGKVPVVVSPGEKTLPPQDAKKVAEGKKSPMEAKTVPGKAKVKGDSLKNDTVPKDLEAGSIVIPRSIINGPDAERNAAAFVRAVMSHKGMPKRE